VNDCLKFKNLLAWFVNQLNINNGVIDGEKVVGRGYKHPKHQKRYAELRSYSDFELDCTIFQNPRGDYATKANHIHLSGTDLSIFPEFNRNSKAVESLFIGNYTQKKTFDKISESVIVTDMGLNDAEPNQTLRIFFDMFVMQIKKHTSSTTTATVDNFDKDYSNFFNMLKFWIEQTENNISNTGKRVSTPAEIYKDNVSIAVDAYTDPQFKPEYLDYKGFSTGIAFFRSGNYQGRNVNIVGAAHDVSLWLNLRYIKKEDRIVVVYSGDKSDDSQGFKDYMIKAGYDKDKSFSLDELELRAKEPNDKVKELFDYYNKMIDYAKNYIKGGESSMKSKELTKKLLQSYNLILRGAPGTGKTYLAKEIASELIGIPVEELSNNEQFEFVQFHPSYDYTDFVEGLRPTQINGQVGFEPKDGTFKAFCNRAKLHQDQNHDIFNITWERFIDNVDEQGTVVIPRVKHGLELTYTLNSNRNLKDITTNATRSSITKENIFSVWQGRKARRSGAAQSRMKAIIQHLEEDYGLPKYNETNDFEQKSDASQKFVFVIDEINRGEISKIFGELFYSIEPDYRGVKGAVSTQYANLFDDDEKFYIPENIYIIGTMNDIDRSVDTFDFAMRRRFNFEEITAADSQVMLTNEDVKNRMTRLNEAITSDEIGLSNDYQIGGSYFLLLDKGQIEELELWNSKLKPLLKDYFRGERNAAKKLEVLESAYAGDVNDSSER